MTPANQKANSAPSAEVLAKWEDLAEVALKCHNFAQAKAAAAATR